MNVHDFYQTLSINVTDGRVRLIAIFSLACVGTFACLILPKDSAPEIAC